MSLLVSVAAVGGILVLLIGETSLSLSHERGLRKAGAIEPGGDVYRVMAVVYPLCFVAMGVEHALARRPSVAAVMTGAAIFTLGKALKYWAIATLGPRWTFRVLVPPGAPLVASGPYRFLRHPNYLGVVAELAGAAVALQAPVAGVAGTAGFLALLWRRIRMEERALGLRKGQGPGVRPDEE